MKITIEINVRRKHFKPFGSWKNLVVFPGASVEMLKSYWVKFIVVTWPGEGGSDDDTQMEMSALDK